MGRLVVGLLLLAVGCAPAVPVETLIPVEGKITVKGVPLVKGSVLFMPDKSKGNETKTQPSGAVKDGVYSLKTNDRAGAPAGAYKIAVMAQEGGDSVKPLRWLVNQKYASDQSGLSATVAAQPVANAYNFDLEP